MPARISLHRHKPARFAYFDAQVPAAPEVQGCSLIAGRNIDCQLKVVVHDKDAYPNLLSTS
jgi:Lrp/AsnC family leucine-responsive transcriptional regulator